MSGSTIERQWTAHGFDCVVLRMDFGHRCGYVRVPDDHPWHGIAYNEAAPTVPRANEDFAPEDDVGIIAAFCYGIADEEKRAEYNRTPEFQIRAHGGLTFSGGLPHGLDGHWFGFDCAHTDDSPAYWDEWRVAAETERVAEQLADLSFSPAPRKERNDG